ARPRCTLSTSLSPLSFCTPCSLAPPSFSSFFFLILRPPPTPTLFPYTTLFRSLWDRLAAVEPGTRLASDGKRCLTAPPWRPPSRSEEHTSELQSLTNLVCRLLLEKKKKKHTQPSIATHYETTRTYYYHEHSSIS